MQPGWLPDNPDNLASDPDLRAVQVQWLWDTLYMRRITFCASITAIPVNLAVLTFAPRAAVFTLPLSLTLGLAAAAIRTVRRRGRRS